MVKDENNIPQEDLNTSVGKQDKEKPSQERVSQQVRNRKYFNLLTGGDMSKYCPNCGGVCSNSRCIGLP